MDRLKAVLFRSPAWICAGLFLFLGVYLAPPLVYFSARPALILSEPSAREILAMPDFARRRAVERMKSRNVQGVAFREATLADLESAGRVFVASGADLLRLFKIQSIASYYVFEQVRDKNLKLGGSYIFFSESVLFEYVYSELKSHLAPGEIAVYERGIFRADASFPDNFVLESSLSPDVLRHMPLGWLKSDVDKILKAISQESGDSLWPVFHPSKPGTAVPEGQFVLTESHLRPPYDIVRIVRDPLELVDLPSGSALSDLRGLPVLPTHALLAFSIIFVLIALLRIFEWISWAPLLAAVFVVLTLALLPTQLSWVAGGLVFLVPPASLLLWTAAAESFRLKAQGVRTSPANLGIFFGQLLLFLAVPGWLVSALMWSFAQLPLKFIATSGTAALPLVSAALFLLVWAIGSQNKPVYLRHILTGLEITAVTAVLFFVDAPWVLAPAGVWAWFRWFFLLERTRGRAQEDSPGNFAAFITASALGLKLFVSCPPLTALAFLLASPALAVLAARLWISKSSAAQG